jgi:hypothetical protein
MARYAGVSSLRCGGSMGTSRPPFVVRADGGLGEERCGGTGGLTSSVFASLRLSLPGFAKEDGDGGKKNPPEGRFGRQGRILFKGTGWFGAFAGLMVSARGLNGLISVSQKFRGSSDQGFFMSVPCDVGVYPRDYAERVNNLIKLHSIVKFGSYFF